MEILGYNFYWSLVWDELPGLLNGAVATIEITALSVVIGTAIAMPLAILRQGGQGPGFWFATTWVSIARNTPALFQIYMLYFGIGSFGVNLGSYFCVLAAVTFNFAGYLTEILRGGLIAVPKQQLASSISLGMTTRQAYVNVVFPQVFKIVFFPFTSQLVLAMLTTSLGMFVGLRELTGAAQYAQSVSFRTFEVFLIAAALYYALAKLIELSARYIFWRMYRVSR